MQEQWTRKTSPEQVEYRRVYQSGLEAAVWQIGAKWHASFSLKVRCEGVKAHVSFSDGRVSMMGRNEFDTADNAKKYCDIVDQIIERWRATVPTAKTGLLLVANERIRQLADEGYAPKHDSMHKNGELAQASIAYLYKALGVDEEKVLKDAWPSNFTSFKGDCSNIRLLEKAGALVAAEIDRLLAEKEDTDEIPS